MDTWPRGPAADQRPEQRVGGRTPQSPPPPKAGREGTSPRHRQRPLDELGQCATGLRNLAVTQSNHQEGEDTPQKRGHNAGNPEADKDMTEASGPQESGGPSPTASSCLVPPHQEPSTGSVPEGRPETAPGHPSPTGTTPDQDLETMPPPPPRPPQQRNTDLFDGEELRAMYDIHANPPPCGLVGALRGNLQDVNPNRLFAVVPLPHAASTDISVRQLQAIVTSRMQIAEDLLDVMIWWFNFNQRDQGLVWVPHLSCALTLVAPPTEPRDAPSTGGRKQAAPQPIANALNIPPYNGLADCESSRAPIGGAASGTWWSDGNQGR